MVDIRTCSECPAPITRQSKTGRCRRCALRRSMEDPAIFARKRQRLAVAMADPDVRARHSAACIEGAAKRVADPEKLAKLVDLGRTYGRANLQATRNGEVRARASRSIQRRHLAWCPEPYWPLNQKLKRNGYRLPERKQMIASEILREAAQREAAKRAAFEALTPFERQLERVRNGAKLIAKPDFRKSGPAYTLGGVAPEPL